MEKRIPVPFDDPQDFIRVPRLLRRWEIEQVFLGEPFSREVLSPEGDR